MKQSEKIIKKLFNVINLMEFWWKICNKNWKKYRFLFHIKITNSQKKSSSTCVEFYTPVKLCLREKNINRDQQKEISLITNISQWSPDFIIKHKKIVNNLRVKLAFFFIKKKVVVVLWLRLLPLFVVERKDIIYTLDKNG